MTKPLHPLLLLVMAMSALTACDSFAFQLPKIQLPWDNNAPSSSSVSVSSKSPVRSNDKIVIFGGTGGVGQLITRKLRAKNKGYQICVVARDAARATEVLTADDAALGFPSGDVTVVELNLVGENMASDDALRKAMDGCTGIIVSVGTTAFPTKKWQGGNVPTAIDQDAVSRIANLASDVPTLRRMALVTSIGVERTKEMPFLILNLCGVLDAKRAGEDAVKASATLNDFGYSIVRPGRLVGGPYTNEDLAKLFQVDGGASNGVSVERGDTLLGDCKRDAAAEAMVQCLENAKCVDLEFCMVSNEEKPITDGEWGEAFKGMRM